MACRREAITWTNAGLLSIEPLGKKFQRNLNRNSYIFVQEKTIENIVGQIGGHFVHGEMS